MRQVVDAAPHQQSKVLRQYFKRDVYVLLAYAMSRTDAEQQAVQVMNQALQMPLSYPIPERRFRDYAYATGVYFCVPSCQKQVIQYGRKALDEVRKCQNKSGAQWLVTALGSMYHRQGKIDKAIEMYQEGYDLAVLSGDTLGMANAKKMMADYLLQWKLDSISDKYVTEAVSLLSHVGNVNPMVAIGIYVTKARILKDQHKKQEALKYLGKAKSWCMELPYNSGASDVDLLLGSLLVNGDKPRLASDDKDGMELLTSAAHQATYQIKATAFFELAKANIERGNSKEGEAALDSMWHILHSTSSSLMVDDAYDYALNYYLKVGNQSKVALYSAALQQMKSKAERAATIKNVIDAITHLELEKKNRELSLQTNEMARRRTTDLVLWIGLAVLLLGGLCLFFYKRKQYQREHVQTQEKLTLMQETLRQTMEQKEQALSKLVEVKAENVQQIKSTEVLLGVLKNSNLTKFLESFEQAYPHFRKKLSSYSSASRMTDKDTVYCCLMALGLDNGEIAQALNVERPTVVLAKYRLRKKLVLGEPMEMEKLLKNLLVDEMK